MGPFLNAEQIKHFSFLEKIEEDFENQRSTIYLNNIPNAFDKVDQTLQLMKDSHKKWKTTSGIRTVEAFNCNLKNIDIVANFTKLTELNISNNPEVTSLKNIGSCEKLKILDCKGCNLKNVDEVAPLTKLEHLNLSQNFMLESIEGLSNLT